MPYAVLFGRVLLLLLLQDLFKAMKRSLGAVPILAEDLGVITSDVVALR